MKILVTGCAGFIGFHTVRKLIAAGHSVVGVDDLNDYYDPELKKARLEQLGINVGKGCAHGELFGNGNFSFYFCDIAEKEKFEACLEGHRFGAVCHLAAQAGVRYSIENPYSYEHSNLLGFLNVMEFCRHNGIRWVMYASSSSVYGNSAEIPYRETQRTDSPASFYGATKKANEIMAYSYSSLYGIHTIGLRFFTVYGPWGRPDMAPFLFTRAIMSEQQIEVYNNGDMLRDFTYIDDVVDGVVRACTWEPATKDALQGPGYRIYNIGNSKPVNLMNFINTIENVVGKKARIVMQPMQAGDVRATWADTSLLEKDYGYRPSTPLEEGMKRFIEWYMEFYKI